jgi:hypothetical protein
VDPRGDLDTVEERKFSCPAGNRILVVQPVARRYIDCAILVVILTSEVSCGSVLRTKGNIYAATVVTCIKHHLTRQDVV